MLAALFSGAGDFFGGLASRAGRPLAVAIGNNVAGVAAAALLSLFVAGSPIAADLGWGAAAGVAGGFAVLALYRGFAASHIAIVSPIAAVGAAGWPVIYALGSGDRPTGAQAAGLFVGFVAIWTISRSPDPGARTTSTGVGVAYGLGAGLGFGALLIFLSLVGPESGAWPLVPARLAGGLVLLLIGMIAGAELTPVRGSIPAVAAAGVLTVIGNGSFILASNRGSLAVVSVLAAMFPAATVILARVVLGEQLGPRRVLGLVLALLAVGLVAAG